jgi:hypothetical protein
MQKKMKKPLTGLMLLFLLLTFTTTSRAQAGFTQKDRDILIQLQTKVAEMEKRFEQRFEQIDKRFSELREDGPAGAFEQKPTVLRFLLMP